MNYRRSLVIVVSSVIFFSVQSYAVDASKLCNKMQVCLKAEMGNEEIPPEMQQMMNAAINSMCDNVTKKLESATGEEEEKVIACINAMSSASCDVLMNGEVKECESLGQ